MHLIGLVVAGQRVHHDIDAEAERHLALLVATGRNIGHLPSFGIDRPSRRPVIAADDHGRYAVAAARRPGARTRGRHRLDPHFPPSQRPGKSWIR